MAGIVPTAEEVIVTIGDYTDMWIGELHYGKRYGGIARSTAAR